MHKTDTANTPVDRLLNEVKPRVRLKTSVFGVKQEASLKLTHGQKHMHQEAIVYKKERLKSIFI